MRAGVLFNQNNAPAHKTIVAMAPIKEMGIEFVRHPHYSPDLALNGYCLFSRLKAHLRVKKFEDDSEAMAAVEAFFRELKNKNFPREFWIKQIDVLNILTC